MNDILNDLRLLTKLLVILSSLQVVCSACIAAETIRKWVERYNFRRDYRIEFLKETEK